MNLFFSRILGFIWIPFFLIFHLKWHFFGINCSVWLKIWKPLVNCDIANLLLCFFVSWVLNTLKFIFYCSFLSETNDVLYVFSCLVEKLRKVSSVAYLDILKLHVLIFWNSENMWIILVKKVFFCSSEYIKSTCLVFSLWKSWYHACISCIFWGIKIFFCYFACIDFQITCLDFLEVREYLNVNSSKRFFFLREVPAVEHRDKVG